MRRWSAHPQAFETLGEKCSYRRRRVVDGEHNARRGESEHRGSIVSRGSPGDESRKLRRSTAAEIETKVESEKHGRLWFAGLGLVAMALSSVFLLGQRAKPSSAGVLQNARNVEEPARTVPSVEVPPQRAVTAAVKETPEEPPKAPRGKRRPIIGARASASFAPRPLEPSPPEVEALLDRRN